MQLYGLIVILLLLAGGVAYIDSAASSRYEADRLAKANRHNQTVTRQMAEALTVSERGKDQAERDYASALATLEAQSSQEADPCVCTWDSPLPALSP